MGNLSYKLYFCTIKYNLKFKIEYREKIIHYLVGFRVDHWFDTCG